MKFFKYVFMFWLAVLPFITFRGNFEIPKLWVFYLGFVPVIFYWIYTILKRGKSFNFLKSDYFYLCWLLVLLISSFLLVSPQDSIIGGSYRHQGLIFFLAIWVVAKTIQTFGKEEKLFFSKLVALSIILESLLILFEFLFGKLYFGHALGTVGEANAVSGFLSIGSYFVFENLPWYFSFLVFVPLVISLSRSGILSFFAQLGRFVILTTGSWRKLFIFILTLMSISLVAFVGIEKFTSRFENRFLIWNLGIRESIKQPLLGYGLESGERLYNSAFAEINLPLKDLIIDRSHNLFLDIFMWSGGIGLIIFCLFIYQVFNESRSLGKRAALVSFLVFSFFQPLSIVHWLLLAEILYL